MPQRIRLPDGNIAEFPDDFSDDKIVEVLQREFPKPTTEEKRPTTEARPAVTDQPDLTAPITPVQTSEERTAREFYAQRALLGGGIPTRPHERITAQSALEGLGPSAALPNAQTLADALDVIKAYVSQSEEKIAALGEPSRQPTRIENILTGTQQAAADIEHSIRSPLGILTLGSAAAPKIVQTAAKIGFGTHMATQIPGQVAGGVEAIQAGDEAAATRNLLGAGIGAGFVGGLGKSAYSDIRQMLPRTSRALVETVKEPRETQIQKEKEVLTEPEAKAQGAIMAAEAEGQTVPIQPTTEITRFSDLIITPTGRNSVRATWKTPTGTGSFEGTRKGLDVVLKNLERPVTIPTQPAIVARETPFESELRQASEAGKEPTRAAAVPPPEPTAPATITGEIKSPAAPETPVAAEPSTPISTTEVVNPQVVARPGPGAASPAEFLQRARETPPENPPPTVIEGDATPASIEVSRKPSDYHIANIFNSPQAVFSSGKLGEAAKSAWENMALSEFEMRESIKRDVQQYVDGTLNKLPRAMRKEGGKSFFDILDGRGIEEIEAAWAGKPNADQVIPAARALKTRLEEIRATIRDTKRERYGQYLNGLDAAALQDLYRTNISAEYAPANRKQIVDSLVLNSFPDDWGIADGSYLPHLFFGNWKITTQKGDAANFVTRAATPEEAKARIREIVRNNPEFKDATFNVEQDTVIPADMVRLFDKRFFNLVKQMKDATGLTPSEVKQAQQGIIGRKASKQKWFGSLQRREGFQNYSKDFGRVLTAYLSGFHRWRVLSKLQNEVTPLIEQVKGEGRPNAAVRLEGLMENLWGKPSESSLQFDAFLQRFPWLRDRVEPLALDRWGSFVRSLAATGHLTTLRYAVINRLQPLQGLYPIIGEGLLIRAKLLQHSAEGRALLDKHGVTFDIGQFGELGAGGKLSRIRERLTGERSNQELGFLGVYLHGLEQGMVPESAGRYAKLRGQLATQFSPLTVDIPQAFEGPVAQTVFQYKRFTVKQLELLGRLAKEGNLSGLSRMLVTMGLIGGANYYARQFFVPADERKRIYDTLQKEYGKDGADFIFYGLPGLLNVDLSGSLILGDQPRGNIYETVGRATTGPAVSSAIDLAKTLVTDEREATSTTEKTLTAMKRIPALKPIAEAVDVLQGDLDVTTPDGEVKYRRALKDTLVGLGSFRSKGEANMQLAIDAIFNLKKEIQQLKNDYYVASERGDTDTALEAIDKFNERWPEAAITGKELSSYLNYRRRGTGRTDAERIEGRKFRGMVEQP